MRRVNYVQNNNSSKLVKYRYLYSILYSSNLSTELKSIQYHLFNNIITIFKYKFVHPITITHQLKIVRCNHPKKYVYNTTQIDKGK